MRRRQFLAGLLLAALPGRAARAASDWKARLPAPVAQRRQAILMAASGSLEDLARLTDERFVFTKGLAENHLDYWRSLHDQGVDVRRIVRDLLDQEPGMSPEGSWVWPAAGLDGGYPDWRTSIAVTGRWEWLVYDD